MEHAESHGLHVLEDSSKYMPGMHLVQDVADLSHSEQGDWHAWHCPLFM